MRLTWATPTTSPRSRMGTVIIFWIGTAGRSLILTLSKNETCFTIGTLFIASPDLRARTLTAMESRLLMGIVPRSANLRGAAKRRCFWSEVRTRIATSSFLAPNSIETLLTIRSAMSRNSSRGLPISPFLLAMAVRMSMSSCIHAPRMNRPRDRRLYQQRRRA